MFFSKSESTFFLSPREKIFTQRLLLKRASIFSINRHYVKALNDERVMKLTEARFVKWNFLSAARFIMSSNGRGNSVLFSVYYKGTSNWIGNVRLFNWHPHHKTAEISFLFFNICNWGKGYGSEAVEGILNFAKERMGVRKVFGDYYEINKGSERLFQKLAFQIEGNAKSQFLLNGAPVNSIRVGRILYGN